MTEKEIDERISRAVEQEVARRLEERQKIEEEHRERLEQLEITTKTENVKLEVPETMLPSGVLTPLLKRHRDLDDELKARLRDLESKVDRDAQEVQLADVLSPVSKKRTGRAYVALARAHCQKGNLQVALELYRKAESYVPDNIKLKERIIEIEWAVKNDKQYVPSPKVEKTKKIKGRGLKKSLRVLRLRDSPKMATAPEGSCMDTDEWQDVEETKENEESGSGPSPNKRVADGEVDTDTPLKKQRRGSESGDCDGWIPPAPTKRGKRKLGERN